MNTGIDLSSINYDQLLSIAKKIDPVNYMDIAHDHLLTGKSLKGLKYDYLTVNSYDTTVYEGTGKACSKCNEVKPVACFHVIEFKGKKYLSNICSQCHNKKVTEYIMTKYHSDPDFRRKWINRVKKWKADNREKDLQQKRDYYYRNREKEAERKRIYRAKNKEKIKAQESAYRQRIRISKGKSPIARIRRPKMTKAEELEQRRQYRIKNREILKERYHEYYSKNREIISERKKAYYQKNREKILAKKKLKDKDHDNKKTA